MQLLDSLSILYYLACITVHQQIRFLYFTRRFFFLQQELNVSPNITNSKLFVSTPMF